MLPERAGDRREGADHQHDASWIDRAGRAPERDEHVGEREGGAGHQPAQNRDARARAIHLLAQPEQRFRHPLWRPSR